LKHLHTAKGPQRFWKKKMNRFFSRTGGERGGKGRPCGGSQAKRSGGEGNRETEFARETGEKQRRNDNGKR